MQKNICHKCGFTFYSNKTEYICKDCAPIANLMYDRITAYLKQYPNSNTLQISEALDIPAYEVLTYVKSGFLQESHGHFEQLNDSPILSGSKRLQKNTQRP